MSFEKFQLQPIITAELYNNSEFILEESQANEDYINSTSYKHLGSYAKQILILVEDDKHQYIPDKEMELLLAILMACRLSMKDVGISNIHKLEKKEISTYIAELKPKQIILLGDIKLDASMESNYLNSIQLFTHIPVLNTYPLSVLLQDPAAKKALWGALKTFFQL